MKRPYGSEIKLDKFIAEMSIVYATSLEIFGQIMNKHNKKKNWRSFYAWVISPMQRNIHK